MQTGGVRVSVEVFRVTDAPPTGVALGSLEPSVG